MQPDEGVMKIVMIVTMIASFVVGLAIQALVCWLLTTWLSRVPREHRRVEAGTVWLLMIPFFSAVWSFIVYPRISDSFASWYRARGREESGGRSLALAYCVVTVLLLPASLYSLATNPVFRGEPPPQGIDPAQMGLSCIGVVAFVLWVFLLAKYYVFQKEIRQAEIEEAEAAEEDEG